MNSSSDLRTQANPPLSPTFRDLPYSFLLCLIAFELIRNLQALMLIKFTRLKNINTHTQMNILSAFINLA